MELLCKIRKIKQQCLFSLPIDILFDLIIFGQFFQFLLLTPDGASNSPCGIYKGSNEPENTFDSEV